MTIAGSRGIWCEHGALVHLARCQIKGCACAEFAPKTKKIKVTVTLVLSKTLECPEDLATAEDERSEEVYAWLDEQLPNYGAEDWELEESEYNQLEEVDD